MGARLYGSLTLIDLLLLLGVLVVVPLAMRLTPLRGAMARRVLGVARLVQPLGALAVLVAFLLPAGWTAGSIAAGWLLVCGVASLAGLLELIETRSLRGAQLVPAAALLYLSVGAAWLTAARLGLRPMGFSPAIVELTGMHFHYAGFAASVMGSLTLQALSGRPGRVPLVAETAALSLAAGTPLTATGIATSSALFTIVGPIVLGVGVLTTAALSAFAVAPAVANAGARWLLRLSSAAVVIPMLLGVDYALSRVFPTLPALDIPTMALIHGDLNAIAFSLAGILGWTLALRGTNRRQREVA
jgi:YndJ-like protein